MFILLCCLMFVNIGISIYSFNVQSVCGWGLALMFYILWHKEN